MAIRLRRVAMCAFGERKGKPVGIRVHKVIGYGLTDIQHKRGRVVDPRLNMECIDKLRYPRYSDDGGEVGALTVSRFYKWIKCNRRLLAHLAVREGRPRESVRDHHMDEGLFLMRYLRDRKKRLRGPALHEFLATKKLSFSDAVVYEDEGGLRNVMVFRPFSCVESWSRYDDILDYVEETAFCNSRSRVRELSSLCGIYPYTGSMIRVREPSPKVRPALKKLTETEREFNSHTTHSGENDIPFRIDGGFYNQLVGRWSKKIKPYATGEFLEHLLNDWRPALPIELLWVLTYMDRKGCFNDVEAIKQSLRPVLYVYWS